MLKSRLRPLEVLDMGEHVDTCIDEVLEDEEAGYQVSGLACRRPTVFTLADTKFLDVICHDTTLRKPKESCRFQDSLSVYAVVRGSYAQNTLPAMSWHGSHTTNSPLSTPP